MVMPYERGKKESWVKIVSFDTKETEMAFEEATGRDMLTMLPSFENPEKSTLNSVQAAWKGLG